MDNDSILRFEGSIWCNLDIALRNIDRLFQQKIRATGLTVIEYYVLRALYENDGQHASDLAAIVGRAATSFTPNLDKLQNKGYVERRPDPRDRRAVHIFLTDKAHQERERILQLGAAADEIIYDQISRSDAESFHRVIQLLQTIAT